jgi:diguanylate cyclase (GGDEF)-like protein/PAS domain S-box-containing protein
MALEQAMGDHPDGFYKNLLDDLFDGVYFVDRERRITYWNHGAERITGFRGAEVLGSRCAEGVLCHVDDQGQNLCGKRCPLSATMADGRPRHLQIYLHHHDGHRVPVQVRASALRNEQGEIIGAVEVFSEGAPEATPEDPARPAATLAVDPLTGAGNRRFLEGTLRSRLDELRREGWPFGLALMELDRHERLAETWGLAAGDELLRVTARTLRGNARSIDELGRWGGAVFAAVLRGVDVASLERMCARFRALVEQSSIRRGDETLASTLSVGAVVARPEDSLESLVQRATERLAEARAAGGCVMVGS